MKRFVGRHPLFLAALVAVSSLGLAVLSVATSRRAVISDVQDLTPADLAPPTEGEQALALLRGTESFFWFTVSLLAVGLLVWLGWRREAGFVWPPQWRNAYLCILPLLFGVLALTSGVRVPGLWLTLALLLTVAIATFGEEALFRGVMLRALAPSGLLKAVVATSLLAGTLRFGASTLAGPWPEAIQATILSTCGGFTYAALRWRTASIWPTFIVHLLISLAVAISTPSGNLYLILLPLGTLGFILYGLFLLRNAHVRADGGPEIQEERVRAR